MFEQFFKIKETKERKNKFLNEFEREIIELTKRCPEENVVQLIISLSLAKIMQLQEKYEELEERLKKIEAK